MNKKQYILEVAKKQIKEKGYNNISVKSICTEGYISKSTFYYIFDSLDDVLRHCFSQDYVVPAEMKRLIASYDNPLDKIYAFHIINLKHSLDMGFDRISFYLKEALTVSKSSNMVMSSIIADKTIVPFIREAQQKELIKNRTNPEELSDYIRKQMLGCSFDWVTNGGSYSLINDTLNALTSIYDLSTDYSWEKVLEDIQRISAD